MQLILAYIEAQTYDANLRKKTLWEELGAHLPYFYLERMTLLVVSDFFLGFLFGNESYNVYLRRSECSTQPILEICEVVMMMPLSSMAEKFHGILPWKAEQA